MTLFSVGLSGLGTAQQALRATSNNISNVNTPGYSREQAMLAEEKSGGVRVEQVQRQSDKFVNAQLNASVEKASSLEVYSNNMSELDRLLADPDAGLAPIMQNFFNSMRDMASSPANPAARQGVLGTAQTLSAQFRAFDSHLEDKRASVNGQISSEVEQVNNIAEQVAILNKEIVVSRARTGEEPNSLLNKRDDLVATLSTKMGVRLSIQDGGSFNLSLPNGSALVAGDQSFNIEVMESSQDPLRLVVGYRDSAGNLTELPEKDIRGGSLGGIMAFRSEQLDKVQNELGRLAVSLGGAFNEQHKAGVDLNGDPGENFFFIDKPRVLDNTTNATTPMLSAEFTDTKDLTGKDYDLKVTDAATGEFMVRRSDGESFTVTMDGANQIEFEGVRLTVGAPGGLTLNDRFTLQPTRGSAGYLSVEIDDIVEIAAAQSTSSGDNRNALALQDLQSENIIGGRASLTQGYAALVGDVGNSSSVAKVNLEVQNSLTGQVREVQQSISGVNLDEEATNLVRYQQFYQANAKVIQIATTLLDNILNIR
jgi:flagellar hook-associated protein 1 FlgK